MTTRISINDTLIRKVRRAAHGGRKPTREVIVQALEDYVRRQDQMKIFDLFGKVEYYPDYDYKKHRSRA